MLQAGSPQHRRRSIVEGSSRFGQSELSRKRERNTFVLTGL